LSRNPTVTDKGYIHTHYIVEDFLGDYKQRPEGIAPIRVQEFDHNCLLNEGITALLNLLGGIAETAFSNANAYIGVGDSATAAVATQTGLQAASNKLYKAMDATYPSVAAQTVSFRSTFATSEANWDWNEATVASGNSDAADNLNRKVQAMGAKTSAVSRVITIAITIA
jgi:hypothetical protein